MRNTSSVAVMIALSASLALAAPPEEAIVQGLYEGTWKDAGGSYRNIWVLSHQEQSP